MPYNKRNRIKMFSYDRVLSLFVKAVRELPPDFDGTNLLLEAGALLSRFDKTADALEMVAEAVASAGRLDAISRARVATSAASLYRQIGQPEEAAKLAATVPTILAESGLLSI